MKIPYKCKFCGVPGDATFDGTNPNVVYKMDVWKSLLCCNRCADYRQGRRRFIDGIKAACESIYAARLALTGDKLRARETASRDALINVTKKLTTVVCEHYRMTNVWDVEFVNMLMEQPAKWLQFVNHYIKGMAEMSKDPNL